IATLAAPRQWPAQRLAKVAVRLDQLVVAHDARWGETHNRRGETDATDQGPRIHVSGPIRGADRIFTRAGQDPGARHELVAKAEPMVASYLGIVLEQKAQQQRLR